MAGNSLGAQPINNQQIPSPQKSAGWLLTRVQRGLLHAALDHAGEAFDTDPNSLRVAGGEVQPHGVAWPALGVERRAGHISHLLLDSDGEQLQRVAAFRQGQPEEQAALRTGPGGTFRHEILEGLQHGIAAVAINLANVGNVILEPIAACQLIG